MDKKIDIVIVTGFLGAGKTTLLNKLVTSYSGQSIGILVNDFGKVPVDGSLIKDSVEDPGNNKIYEISNGSIFCSCLTSSFVLGLRYFIEKAPDILFIETSGMSDPGSMARLLNEHQIMNAFRIKHVLCVVDATNFLKLRKNMVFVDRQIKTANTVLINKSDLIKTDERSLLSSAVREINEDAHLEYTEYCGFDYKSLPFREFRLPGDTQSCNTSSSAPGKMFLPQMDFPENSFLEFVGSLVEKTLRLKGFYSFGDKEYYLSNNNGLIELKESESNKNRQSGISLIYEGKYHNEIHESWQSFKMKYAF